MADYTYEYPRPGLTSDIILFRYFDQNIEILLIERADYPFAGSWALPGGFVDEGETAEFAAARELKEETGITDITLNQIYTTTTPGRDPRGWTVSVIFYGFTDISVKAIAGDDAKLTKWFPLNQLPELAFDHEIVVKQGINKLKELIRFKVLGHEFFIENFKQSELEVVYDQILNNRKETKKVIEKLITNNALIEKNGSYMFNSKRVNEILEHGYY